MNFALKRPMALEISENIIFDTSSLKVPNFIYLSLLAQRLQRIKARVLQNSENLFH